MVARWDPFADALSVREAVNRLFNDSYARPAASWGMAGATGALPFDLYETPDHVVVRVAAPGIDRSSIDLMVNQGVLTLKATRSFSTGEQEKGHTWHARGLSEGNIQFAVALPVAVDAGRAEAAYEAGILTIELPKMETVKARRISVKGAETAEVLPAGA
ncbi:MAG: Hsp20/alpha crystallin family protein [Dehalococcoidia bacterium]